MVHKSINNKCYQKFRNHCHYIVNYRGVEHNICNLEYMNYDHSLSENSQKKSLKEALID